MIYNLLKNIVIKTILNVFQAAETMTALLKKQLKDCRKATAELSGKKIYKVWLNQLTAIVFKEFVIINNFCLNVTVTLRETMNDSPSHVRFPNI